MLCHDFTPLFFNFFKQFICFQPCFLQYASLLEILFVSTRLGLTSFGGPIAHLGYFHAEYVRKRKWMDEKNYADLVALCQFLPGPASSQVGIGIGVMRASYAFNLASFSTLAPFSVVE